MQVNLSNAHLLKLQDQGHLIANQTEVSTDNELNHFNEIHFCEGLSREEKQWLILDFCLSLWKGRYLCQDYSREAFFSWINEISAQFENLIKYGSFNQVEWDKELFSQEYAIIGNIEEFQKALGLLIQKDSVVHLTKFCHESFFSNHITVRLICDIESKFCQFNEIDPNQRKDIVKDLDNVLLYNYRDKFIGDFDYSTLSIYIILIKMYFDNLPMADHVLEKLKAFLLFLSIPNSKQLANYLAIRLEEEDFSDLLLFSSFSVKEATFSQTAKFKSSYNWDMLKYTPTSKEKEEPIDTNESIFLEKDFLRVLQAIRTTSADRSIENKSKFHETMKMIYREHEEKRSLNEFQVNILLVCLIVERWNFQLNHVSIPPYRKAWYEEKIKNLLIFLDKHSKVAFLSLAQRPPTFHEELYQLFQEILIVEFKRIFQNIPNDQQSKQLVKDKFAEYADTSRESSQLNKVVERTSDVKFKIFESEMAVTLENDFKNLENQLNNDQLFVGLMLKICEEFQKQTITPKEYHFLISFLAVNRQLALTNKVLDSWWCSMRELFMRYLREQDSNILSRMASEEVTEYDTVKLLFLLPLKIEDSCINDNQEHEVNDSNLNKHIHKIKHEFEERTFLGKLKYTLQNIVNEKCCFPKTLQKLI